jgi:hypothetical protein
MHQRRYIQHNYHDHSQVLPCKNEDLRMLQSSSGTELINARRPNHAKIQDATVLFPLKLHKMLESAEEGGFANIISWQIHGRAFKIHSSKDFLEKVVPLHFQHTKMASFRRQLNIYGFLRITQGHDKGAYYHECFLRGKDFLVKQITRQKVKGTMVKSATNPATEPDFYSMSFVKNLCISHEEPSSFPTSDIFSMDYSSLTICAPPVLTPSSKTLKYTTEKGFKPIDYTTLESPTSKLHDNEGACKKKSKTAPKSKTQMSEMSLYYSEWDLDNISLEDDLLDNFIPDCSFQDEEMCNSSQNLLEYVDTLPVTLNASDFTFDF